MKVGEKLPTKVIALSTHETNSKIWEVSGKFYAIAKDGSSEPILSHINILVNTPDDGNHRLPKKWRKAGMKLCNKYNDGISFDAMLKIIKKDGAFDIETENIRDGKYINFKIGKDLNYAMWFENRKNTNEKCKSGLYRIYIGIQEDDDY